MSSNDKPSGDRVHAVEVNGYPGTLAELATEVGRMRYDALAHFLSALSVELQRQADGDRRRGRPKLAARLDTLSADVAGSSAATREVWALCRPHATQELAERPEISE